MPFGFASCRGIDFFPGLRNPLAPARDRKINNESQKRGRQKQYENISCVHDMTSE
jgi:hypothetical protein